METGTIMIPEIQKQCAKIKDELEAIDYKKAIAKYQLDDMNNQIIYLNRISYSKRNEIAYLKIGVQELEGYVHGLQNHNLIIMIVMTRMEPQYALKNQFN